MLSFLERLSRTLKDIKHRRKYSPKEWGEVVSLEAGYTVLDKSGNIVDVQVWKSRSYVRWFGRIVQHMISADVCPLTDINALVYNAHLADESGFSGEGRLVPRSDNGFGGPTPYTGAMLGVGVGPLTGAQSGFTNLKTPFESPFDARLGTYTTQEDGVAIEFAVTSGVVNNGAVSVNISEQALFARIRGTDVQQTNQIPHVQMVAYDEISPVVPLAQGQVFVPKYTLRFAA